jgi:hypothetical protein
MDSFGLAPEAVILSREDHATNAASARCAGVGARLPDPEEAGRHRDERVDGKARAIERGLLH